jgi:ATP-dependent helicase Lhr and Lhr-like helicase
MSPPTAPDATASDRAAPHPVLERFSPAVATWFHTTFPEPTDAQAMGWDAIADGDHTLILAPTGSGKTLAAFLWAIDRQMTSPEPEPARRLGVVYVSPLRALAVDVERNLRAPCTASAWLPNAWVSRCATSRWACAPATRPATNASGWSAAHRTS